MSSNPHAPCAACKCRRQRCTQECIFAPYFPPDDPQKFENVHKVFGASNVAKILHELPPQHRAEAVNSLTYEAQYRIHDPVYGCIALISFLQNRLALLKTELELAKNELATYMTCIQQHDFNQKASCYDQGETSYQIQTNAHLQQHSLLQSNLQYFPQQRSHVPLINGQVHLNPHCPQLMEETDLRQQQMLMEQPTPYPQLRSNVSMLTNQVQLNPNQRGENMVMLQGEQVQSNLQYFTQQRGENEPRHDHGSLLREQVLSNPQYDHRSKPS